MNMGLVVLEIGDINQSLLTFSTKTLKIFRIVCDLALLEL
jgi:hypothetical protein